MFAHHCLLHNGAGGMTLIHYFLKSAMKIRHNKDALTRAGDADCQALSVTGDREAGEPDR